jgi:hypothetical protein
VAVLVAQLEVLNRAVLLVVQAAAVLTLKRVRRQCF